MSDKVFDKSKEKLAENKLMILYLLEKADCTLNSLQIQRLLYELDDFNYYYFQHLISELISQNFIANYQQDDEWLYDLTTQGREILHLTEDILPGIIKDKINKIVKEELSKVKDEVAVTAEYVPINDNEYMTKCKITESHKILFELDLYCGSKAQAKLVADNWKLHANDYYPKIIEMIAKKNETDEQISLNF